MTSLRLYLFGTFEILIDGVLIQNKLWQSRQLRQVFKILADQRNKVVQSDQLIDIIWPDKPPEKSRQYLYVRISQLRKLLQLAHAESLLQHVSEGYVFYSRQVQPDQSLALWVDVDAFEAASQKGQDYLEKKQFRDAVRMLENACHIYRGDYLSEDLYEDWTIGERERLREKYIVTLIELAEAYAQQGFYRRAIDQCKTILSFDPWREAVFVRLMLYYFYAGNKAKALQTYNRCKEILSINLNLEPDPYTIWLAAQIETGKLLPKSDTSYPPPAYDERLFEVPYKLGEAPFTGREREHAWLIHKWRTNPNGLIWINGKPGVGKTRLVEAFLSQIQKDDVRIFRLGGVRDHDLPYGPWIEGLLIIQYLLQSDGLSEKSRSTLQMLISGIARDQQQLFSRASDLLSPASIQNAFKNYLSLPEYPKVLVWIDDAHLLDVLSLRLIKSLMGQIGIILSGRQSKNLEALHYLQDVEKTKLETLVLEPLSLEDTRLLFRRLSGEGIIHLAEHLHVKTGGNPLHILSSLQHLYEKGLLTVKLDGSWVVSGPVEDYLAPRIDTAIAKRLNGLQHQVRAILDVLAVAGGAVEYELLQQVLDQDEATLLGYVDYLIGKGLLVESRKSVSADVSLAHDLFGEVLYKTLPKARKRNYHRGIAEAMLALGQDSALHCSTLANHFHEGKLPEKAIHFARQAGYYALNLYNPQQALSHYTNALNWIEQELLEKPNERSAEIRFETAQALRQMGKYYEALDAYQNALPGLRGELKGATIFQMFSLQILQGKPLSSYEILANEYSPIIEEEGDTWNLALFQWMRSYVALLMGNKKETRRQLALGWRTSRRICAQGEEMPAWIYKRVRTLMVNAYYEWGDYQNSLRIALELQAFINRGDPDVNTQAVLNVTIGDCLFQLGQPQDAEEQYNACLALATKAEDPRVAGEALIGLGRLAFARGEFEVADDYANQVLALVDPKADVLRLTHAIFIKIKLSIVRREIDGVCESLENIIRLAASQDSQPYMVRSLVLLSEAQIAQHNMEMAETSALRASEMSEQNGLKLEWIAALRNLALIQGDTKRGHEAMETICRALKVARAIKSPYEIGLTLLIRAQIQNDPALAVIDAQEALKLFDKLNAKYLAFKTRKLIMEYNLSKGEA